MKLLPEVHAVWACLKCKPSIGLHTLWMVNIISLINLYHVYYAGKSTIIGKLLIQISIAIKPRR